MQCYDSITPTDIPETAPAVLIYGDGDFKWTAADRARFAKARFRTISVLNNPKIAAVLDVERQDATPADAPGFIRERGQDACIYCDRSTLPKVQSACHGLEYRVWLATLDGSKPKAITGGGTLAAVQYAKGPGYDISDVYDVAWLREPVS